MAIPVISREQLKWAVLFFVGKGGINNETFLPVQYYKIGS